MTEQVANQQLITALVPAFMPGIFTLISVILQVKLKNVPMPSPTILPTTGASQFVCLGKVLLHAGIVLVVTTSVFFVIFVTTTYLRVPVNLYLSHFFLFRWVAYILAFIWVAAKVEKAIRWTHLIYVAILVAVITMPIHSVYTVMRGGAPVIPGVATYEIFYIYYTLVQVFVSMGAGGAITNAMKPH